MAERTHKTTFYLQVAPTWYNGGTILSRIKVVGTTQKPPYIPKRGGADTLVVKMTLEVPESAFLRLTPAVEILIDAAQTQPLLAVTVEDPEPDDDATDQ